MREIILVVGKKASGKSVETKKQISNIKDRNTIFFDICLEYEEFEVIHPDKAVDFLMGNEGNIRRIIPFENGEKMSLDQIQKMIEKLLAKVNNGILVLENTRYYASPKILELIKQGNGDKKGHLSVIYQFTSIGTIPNNLLNDANVLRLHKCIDRIDRHKSKIENFEILKIATLIVENKTQDDKYFNCSVNGWRTIEGDFDKSDYRNACIDSIIEKQGLHRYSELY